MVKEMYTYDEETGELYSNLTGCAMGMIDDHGYLRTTINGKSKRIHRLVWEYHNGYEPDAIDHIDKDKLNNKIENLREVSQSVNMTNKSKYKSNKSGVTGVTWFKKNKRWGARIQVDKKNLHLGLFASFSDAVDARKNAEVLYGFTND